MTLRLGLALVLTVALSGAELRAQATLPSGDRRFDAASVKPALSPFEAGRAAASGAAPTAPAFFGTRILPGGRFVGTTTLKQLIALAFDIKDYQIDGGPAWLATNYYEINATAGGDATPAEINAMLKLLLADRFGLRTHTDTRQAPVHVLTVVRADGRLGSSLTRTSADCVRQIEDQKSGNAPARTPASPGVRGLPTTPTCGSITMVGRPSGGFTVLMGGMELTALLSRISNEVAGPVVDRTGLTGKFDITLEYQSQQSVGGRAPGLDLTGTDSPPSPMAAALKSQLGLQLDRQMGPMTIVVVDAVNQPTSD